MEDHRFSGDTSRNEVELDLSKFMAMVQEISDLKEKSQKKEVSIYNDPLHKIELHEKECAQRYKNIEERLESGSKRFDKLETIIWGVYPFILVSLIASRYVG